jgi:hypothetical protein
MWWNEATTLASGPRISWASSAEEPCGGGVNSRPPPKVSGTTVLTTILPRQASRTSGSVAGEPVGGHRQHDDLGGGHRVQVGHAADARARRARGQLGGLAARALGVSRADQHLVTRERPADAEPRALLAGSPHDADAHWCLLSSEWMRIR